MRRAIVLCCVPAAIAACLFPSLDGLMSGDASIDTGADAATPDASSDAIDASPFCVADAHWFCADFDEMNVFDEWTTLLVSSDCTTPVQNTDCISQPYSLACATPIPSPNDSYARLLKALPNTTSSAHLDLEVKLVGSSCDAGAGEAFFELIKFGNGNQSAGIEVKADVMGWYINADLTDGGADLVYLSSAPSYGAWHHLVADLSFATNGSIQVAVDGVSSASVAVDTLSLFQNTGLMVGLYSSGSCPAMTVLVDNLTLDIVE